jgi:Tol biopolymer transport system component
VRNRGRSWVVVVVLGCFVTGLAGAGATGAPSPGGTLVFGCTTCPGETTAAGKGLFSLREDGTGLRRVVTGDDPSWSPGGSWVTYSVEAREIWKASADGSRRVRLLRRKGGYESAREPDWSPDGRRIVFVRTLAQRAGPSRSTLWTMNADGSRLDLLLGGALIKSDPSWSPDGTRIMFNNGRRLFVVRADGTGLRRLGDSTIAVRDARWAPDGRGLAFTSVSGKSLMTLDLTSGRIRALARLKENFGFAPRAIAWSADGRSLAVGVQYCCDEPRRTSSPESHVELVRVSDGRRRVVFDRASIINGLDWSWPSGRRS